MRAVKKLLNDQRGATAIEYGLILALIFLAIIGAVQAFTTNAMEMWTGVSENISAAN